MCPGGESFGPNGDGDVLDDAPGEGDAWEELSLEELGKAYAQVVARNEPAEPPSTEAEQATAPVAVPEQEIEPESSYPDAVPSLSSIIEGALFIGHPDGRAIKESELAGLIRDVTVQEVAEEIDRLNELYKANGQAFRVLRDDEGIRLGVASDLEVVRRAFYGKVREATLSQGAIEVLALVAYQPGITAEKVQDQRGKESASLLNQLVRRRLLEQHRTMTADGKRAPATYFPTERFLDLFGLQSLDDLPQVEE